MKNLRPALIALFLFSFLTGLAQYDVSRIDRKAVALYEQGIELAQNGNYRGAERLLQEAINREAGYIEAYLSLAGVYGQIKNYPKSIATYEKAFALDSNYTSDYRLPYAINLAGAGEFNKALQTIEALLARPNLGANTRKAAEYRQKSFRFAVEEARRRPAGSYVFAPRNLGPSVNSPESEYFPSMPVDGSALIFTRRLRNMNEDFFAAQRRDTGWATSFRLTGNINTPQNEGAQTISQDGNWLVFTGCNRPEGLGSCDLYISYLTNDGWSEAINLGRRINSEHWESQPCLSPDKRDLYFNSNRPGGYGGSDLYVSHLLPNGQWSEPENLGPEVNTPGDEACPLIHADNQTLYFSSNGHLGYGESDLFLVRRQGLSKWGKPENLGYPINTTSNESSLFVAADGKMAYYASDRSDGFGGLDIYSFEMREDIRPAKTGWVKGKVFDKKTSTGLPSTIELIDLASGEVISRVQTDETGNYLVTLPVGKDYAFNVNRRGYLFYSDNYSLKQKSPDATYEKDIPLQPIEVNASVVLRNIFFDVNQYALRPESQIELDRLVKLLQDNPTVRIQLEGHTDNVGTAADNQKLSENRARAVVAYLQGKGIRPERLVAKGFGATQPVADNKTEEGRAQNRRTALKVIAR
jgi:outer membrane protein OmpA-like peptidoglycan-associated protein/tetratricopeptide (TPR) repeat protein